MKKDSSNTNILLAFDHHHHHNILYNKRPATISVTIRIIARPVTMKWGASEGNQLAGGGSSTGPGTGE